MATEKANPWKAEILIATAQKTTHTQLQVRLCTRATDGTQAITIRDWYNTKLDPTLKPGYAGITIPVANAEEIIAAVKKALEVSTSGQ